MKKVIFIVLLLAVASLGLALPPPKSPKTPATPATPTVISPLDSVSAVQDEFKVSPKCASAIFTLVTSPEFLKCVPLPAFAGILPILTDPDFPKKLAADPAGTFKKVEPAFVTFATQFCPATKCSDQGVQASIKLLSDGCSDDLKDNPIVQLLFDAVVFYSPLHDTICFKSTDSKLFCWDESLETVFGLPKSPIKVTGNPLVDSIAVADCKAVCTDCNKSIVNTFFNFIKGNKLALQILQALGVTQQTLDQLTLGVAVKCGINFEDGKIPNGPSN